MHRGGEVVAFVDDFSAGVARQHVERFVVGSRLHEAESGNIDRIEKDARCLECVMHATHRTKKARVERQVGGGWVVHFWHDE